MSIHHVGILGLALIFVFGTLRPVNLGALSLAMAFLVGTLFAGENLAGIYSGFPADLLILLAGVTYLFGIAASNGTVRTIVEGAARLVRDRRALLPWIVFVVAAMPTMAGALGSAGVALLAPVALRLAERYDIDRRMIGLMVLHGAACGNFSPLNVLGAIVLQAVSRNGVDVSASTLFLANIAYNVFLGVIVYLVFGGPGLARGNGVDAGPAAAGDRQAERIGAKLRVDQVCTLIALLAVGIAALAFDLSIGFMAFGAACVLHFVFPASSSGADRRIAWDVVLLVCGIVTYVEALQRYGTVDAIGGSIAGLSAPLVSALLICVVGAFTSAFASSAGILGVMMLLAMPFLAQGDIAATGMVVALAISATVVDSSPFSTAGALVVANAERAERPRIYRGLLMWGAAMVATAPPLTWLIFIVLTG